MSELHETQNKCREPLHQRLYIVKLTVININASSFIVLAIKLFQQTAILLSHNYTKYYGFHFKCIFLTQNLISSGGAVDFPIFLTHAY